MRFSVVIPVYYSHRTLQKCIRALQSQSFSDFEVIFVDSSPDDRCAEVIEKYPNMNLVRSRTRLWMYAARNIGVGKAHGEILVFTDPDCVAEPGWLMKLDESFREGQKVVGGAIACYPAGYREMAAHLVKFWLWLPNGESDFYDDIPTANFAIERSVFDMVGGFSENYFSGDALMGYRLREHGYHLYFNAETTVQHIHEGMTFRTLLKERFIRGNDFGKMRSSLKTWNKLRSLMLLAGLLILPWRQFYCKTIVYIRRGFLRPFLLAAPLILCCDVVWMLGQGLACWRHLFGKNAETLRNQPVN